VCVCRELEKKKFPQSPPRIVLSAHSLTTIPTFTSQGVMQTPPLVHRLLLPDGTVRPDAHPKLLQWTLHNDLGLVIRDLVTLFRNEPPRLADTVVSPSHSFTSFTTPTSTSTSTSTSSTASSIVSQSSATFQLSELRNKPLREVSELLTNETKFQTWFTALDQVRNTATLRDSLRTNNQELTGRLHHSNTPNTHTHTLSLMFLITIPFLSFFHLSDND
jgi:hypothetical protein